MKKFFLNKHYPIIILIIGLGLVIFGLMIEVPEQENHLILRMFTTSGLMIFAGFIVALSSLIFVWKTPNRT